VVVARPIGSNSWLTMENEEGTNCQSKRTVGRNHLRNPSPQETDKSFLFSERRKFGQFCKRKSPIQVPETQSAFHLRAQRNASHCRGARLQSRSFARWNQSLRHSFNSNRLC
jgi:hypothetical protein